MLMAGLFLKLWDFERLLGRKALIFLLQQDGSIRKIYPLHVLVCFRVAVALTSLPLARDYNTLART